MYQIVLCHPTRAYRCSEAIGQYIRVSHNVSISSQCIKLSSTTPRASWTVHGQTWCYCGNLIIVASIKASCRVPLACCIYRSQSIFPHHHRAAAAATATQPASQPPNLPSQINIHNTFSNPTNPQPTRLEREPSWETLILGPEISFQA